MEVVNIKYYQIKRRAILKIVRPNQLEDKL